MPNPGYFAYSCGANTDGSGSGAVNSFLRNRGTNLIPTAVQNNDVIGQLTFAPYNGSGYTTSGAITAKVNTTYGSIVSGGKVPTDMTIQTSSNTTSFTYTFDGAGGLAVPGNVTANNVSVNSGGFIKYAAFASTDLTAITGTIGQMASVSNNGGKLAYWDTDNSRWSYVFDNSAV